MQYVPNVHKILLSYIPSPYKWFCFAVGTQTQYLEETSHFTGGDSPGEEK